MAVGVIFPEGVFPTGLFSGFPLYGSTASYASIRYTWEENEVYQQYIGDTIKYPVQVLDSSGNVVETLVSPVVYVKVNDAAATTQTWTISDFDSIMATFTLEVPSTIDTVAMTSGDIAEIAIVDTGVGRGHLTIQFISSEVTATGSGSEKVIPLASITLNSAAKTITLASPYDTITVEQILSIRNITENQDIYNSKVTHEGKQIHITTPGVIEFDYSGTMVDLTDIIQIIYI